MWSRRVIRTQAMMITRLIFPLLDTRQLSLSKGRRPRLISRLLIRMVLDHRLRWCRRRLQIPHELRRRAGPTRQRASERADMVDALKRSTDAIVSRKPKHECLVWAESIGMRMMVMPQQQRSLVRLRMEQAMFDIEFEFQATHQPLTPDGVSQCATEQYTTLTDVVGCLVPTQFCNN